MKIKIPHIETDFSIDDFDNAGWKNAEEILIENYWSGEKAEIGRYAKAKLLWSENALYAYFEANQFEPLIVNSAPDLKAKTVGLWERDVCEIFIAPDIETPQKYFEFEIAPTGEWLDLAIRQMPEKRETDWEYDSGMQSAARIEKDKVLMTIKVEWKAFGRKPKANDVWKGNLFRCVGFGKTRGCLAWQPTLTAQPNFHIPERFGEFVFIK